MEKEFWKYIKSLPQTNPGDIIRVPGSLRDTNDAYHRVGGGLIVSDCGKYLIWEDKNGGGAQYARAAVTWKEPVKKNIYESIFPAGEEVDQAFICIKSNGVFSYISTDGDEYTGIYDSEGNLIRKMDDEYVEYKDAGKDVWLIHNYKDDNKTGLYDVDFNPISVGWGFICKFRIGEEIKFIATKEPVEHSSDDCVHYILDTKGNIENKKFRGSIPDIVEYLHGTQD